LLPFSVGPQFQAGNVPNWGFSFTASLACCCCGGLPLFF
jgi:hypothetical protein